MGRTLLGLFLALTMGLSCAWAKLGGSEASIDTDNQRVRSVRHSTSNLHGYRIHELNTEIGGTIHEYVSSKGVIFAVTWDGPAQPDLSNLLGDYFKEYNKSRAQGAPHKGHSPSTIHAENIVVEHSGHMGSIHGRAWIVALLPSDFSLDDVK